MSAEPESLAAILAEFRAFALRAAEEDKMISPESVLLLADRIEAAAERERIKRDKVSFRCGDCAKFGGDCDAGDVDGNEDCIACEKFARRAAPGNAAAMREALEKFLDFSRRGLAFFTSYRYTEAENAEIEAAFYEAKNALAAPARNCDVGTKEEQHKRFKEFCEERDCHKCPFYGIADCPIEWLNAPFAPEKEKEDNQ